MQTIKHTVRTAFNRRLFNQAGDLSAGQKTTRTETPSVSSQCLFGEHDEIDIMHCGERYSLRITRLDKLILTK